MLVNTTCLTGQCYRIYWSVVSATGQCYRSYWSVLPSYWSILQIVLVSNTRLPLKYYKSYWSILHIYTTHLTGQITSLADPYHR